MSGVIDQTSLDSMLERRQALSDSGMDPTRKSIAIRAVDDQLEALTAVPNFHEISDLEEIYNSASREPMNNSMRESPGIRINRPAYKTIVAFAITGLLALAYGYFCITSLSDSQQSTVEAPYNPGD